MTIEEHIKACFQTVVELRGAELKQEITPSSELLKTGLDSLGFAMLVVKLEEALGFDPFLAMDEPIYPKTYGEFVKIYEDHSTLTNVD